jgi:hypothetical protein
LCSRWERGRRGDTGAVVCPFGGRRLTPDRVDPNRDVMQLLDLPDGHGAIRTIKDALDKTALRIPGAIGKLWHTKFLLLANLSRTPLSV